MLIVVCERHSKIHLDSLGLFEFLCNYPWGICNWNLARGVRGYPLIEHEHSRLMFDFIHSYMAFSCERLHILFVWLLAHTSGSFFEAFPCCSLAFRSILVPASRCFSATSTKVRDFNDEFKRLDKASDSEKQVAKVLLVTFGPSVRFQVDVVCVYFHFLFSSWVLHVSETISGKLSAVPSHSRWVCSTKNLQRRDKTTLRQIFFTFQTPVCSTQVFQKLCCFFHLPHGQRASILPPRELFLFYLKQKHLNKLAKAEKSGHGF